MNRKLKNEELERPSLHEARAMTKLPIVVVLDNVRSMANVGSVFRTCDAFNVQKLILLGITPQPPHREIHKTALGATDSVKWVHRNDAINTIQELKEAGYQIYCAEQTVDSKRPEELGIHSRGGICLIFGNEVEGVSQEIINVSDVVLEIPQDGTKHSLNISVAAGIIIWEAFKAFRS